MPFSEFYDLWKMGTTFVCVVGIVALLVSFLEEADRKSIIHVIKNISVFHNKFDDKQPWVIAASLLLLIPIGFHHLGNLLNGYVDVFGLFIHIGGITAIDILIYEKMYNDATKSESVNSESSDRNNYDDFEENTHQSRTHNTKPDDEFSYDNGRFSDDRFSTERNKKKYMSLHKGAHDEKASREERKRFFSGLMDADSGKIKGIEPWNP